MNVARDDARQPFQFGRGMNWWLDRKTDQGFYHGFYGNKFREFDSLGEQTVRHKFENGKFADEMYHNAAEIWLGRKERRTTLRANLVSYISLAVSVAALVVALL